MRVLFCGLGGIGQRHLRNLRSLVPSEQLEVHAYRVLGRSEKLRDDLSIERDRDIVTDYGVQVHNDMDDALSARPDVAFICNPSSLHTGLALQAAEADVHLFIEKPVSDAWNGLGELLGIVEERKLVCSVGYNFRFHPALQRIKALLEEGHFGTVIAAHFEIGEYLPNWHLYEDYRSMYASRADLGGGVILSQIHEMDLIYWFFGMPTSIYSLGGKLSNLEIDVEDTATSLMQCRGSLGDFPIMLHQDYLQRPPVRNIKIVGDRGTAEVNMIRNHLIVFDASGETVEQWDGADYKRNDMFRAQMQHFLAAVANHSAPAVSLRDGMQSLRLALAAKSSMVGGSVIFLDDGVAQ